MKLTQHEGRSRPREVGLATDPLVIWLTPRLELHINTGDTVEEIADVVLEHLPVKNRKKARAVASYWFDMGERAAQAMLGKKMKKPAKVRKSRKYHPALVVSEPIANREK